MSTNPARWSMPEKVRGVGGYGVCKWTGRISAGWFEYHAIVLPYWLLMTPFAAMVAIRAIDWRRRRVAKLRAQGRCEHCGYDLRATPDVCPECGARAGAAEVSA